MSPVWRPEPKSRAPLATYELRPDGTVLLVANGQRIYLPASVFHALRGPA